MRAWVFTDAATPMRLETAPAPTALPAGSALVRLTAATICGSDVHTMDGTRTDPAAPLVLGHEGVGVVAMLGPGAPPGGVALGERVTWSVAASECGGACEPCTRWRLPQKCARLKKYGHASWGAPGAEGFAGTYASHVLLTAGSCVVRLPASLPDAVAAPVNCALATMVNAVCNSGLPRGSDGGSGLSSALVQGAGMLGLYGVALLKHGGAGGGAASAPPFVVVTDVSAPRLELARRFGADAVVDVRGKDDAAVAAELAALLAAAAATAGSGGGAQVQAPSPAGFDMALEVCGSASVVPLALRALRPGGELVFVGMVHPKTPLAGVTGDAVIRRCATIRGVHNYAPADLAAAVAFLDRTAGLLPYGELVSQPFPLERLPAAVELARTGQFARVLVVPSE